MSEPFALVSGAGPALGQTLVRRFQHTGYNAYCLNRTVPDGAKNTLSVDLSDAEYTAHQPPFTWTQELDLQPMGETF